MSISTIYSPEHFVGDGTQDTYEFSWRILAKTDLVAITKTTLGVVTVLVLDTDYTIADADVNNSAGGEIVLTVDLPNTVELFLIRATARTQEINIPEGQAFPSSVVNEGFDRLTMMIQEIDYAIRQCLRFPNSSTFVDIEVPEPENSLLLQWSSLILANSDGSSIILDSLPSSDPGVPGKLYKSSGFVKVSL